LRLKADDEQAAVQTRDTYRKIIMGLATRLSLAPGQ